MNCEECKHSKEKKSGCEVTGWECKERNHFIANHDHMLKAHCWFFKKA